MCSLRRLSTCLGDKKSNKRRIKHIFAWRALFRAFFWKKNPPSYFEKKSLAVFVRKFWKLFPLTFFLGKKFRKPSPLAKLKRASLSPQVRCETPKTFSLQAARLLTLLHPFLTINFRKSSPLAKLNGALLRPLTWVGARRGSPPTSFEGTLSFFSVQAYALNHHQSYFLDVKSPRRRPMIVAGRGVLAAMRVFKPQTNNLRVLVREVMLPSWSSLFSSKKTFKDN